MCVYLFFLTKLQDIGQGKDREWLQKKMTQVSQHKTIKGTEEVSISRSRILKSEDSLNSWRNASNNDTIDNPDCKTYGYEGPPNDD